jgi:hypothetical protein
MLNAEDSPLPTLIPKNYLAPNSARELEIFDFEICGEKGFTLNAK